MKYNGSNLQDVLENHKRWLESGDGRSGERADFIEADLTGVSLSGADLRGALFCKANLKMADLNSAILRFANLSSACLEGAILIDADLREANMTGTALREAKMCGAILTNARMPCADLSCADLRMATMIAVDMRESNLNGADFSGAYMSGANFYNAKNIPFIPMACPDSGAFIGWKKCVSKDGAECIVKLLIPEDAERSSAAGRKCRASCAKVLEIQTVDGDLIADSDTNRGVVAYSRYYRSFVYTPGEYVMPRNPFCTDRLDECASGIHFFINRQEAVDY